MTSLLYSLMSRIANMLLIGTVLCSTLRAETPEVFLGTNAPGEETHFAITVPEGSANLSLTVTNNSSGAFSWLLLTPGGIPTATDFTYASRLNEAKPNQINLEAPELATGDFGLSVFTPINAADSHNFNVIMTTNRTDLRSAEYPVMKPVNFSTTGSLTNTQWHYFQVDMPTNLLSGWRITLNTTSMDTVPSLYVQRGQLPQTWSHIQAGTPSRFANTIVLSTNETTAGTYFIGVHLPAGEWGTIPYTLSTELAAIMPLPWDPGTTDAGTMVYTNQSATGGQYFFRVNTESTARQIWRVALNVTSGSAHLYVQQDALPATTYSRFSSVRDNASNGVVIAQGHQFSPGQTWHLLVVATPGAEWNIVSGEAYVQPLPPIAADGSSGTTATISAEGMRFFSTTAPAGMLAWRLWANNASKPIYVRKAAAPHPAQGGSTYDMMAANQLLIVPDYLTSGIQYFVGVPGTPGESVTLDSRQHEVTDLGFNTSTNITISASEYGYRTFRVLITEDLIGWQINAMSSVGKANVAVRENNVPNQWVNGAFSEPPANGVGASATIVPEVLRNGTYYITVYGTAPYTMTLTNGEPVITDVGYTFDVTNDMPGRVGWRFYRLTDIPSQLGSLGWGLELSNHVPGTQIALRRNYLPGEWNSRNNHINNNGSYDTISRRDFSSDLGFLQRPGHQADVWYIGVYTPADALGSFRLTGQPLAAPPVAFDGMGSTFSVVNQPAGKWQYFVFTVPMGALGWDVRIENATGGSPILVVRRALLPQAPQTDGQGQYGEDFRNGTIWPSGHHWTADFDWTGYGSDYDGANRNGHTLQAGMNSPLEPGTYYVGIYNTHNSQATSYTLRSRGIGTGMAIPVTPLAYSNGVAIITDLPPREVAYFSVEVPSGMPSWNVELNNTAGEGLLIAIRDRLPSIRAGNFRNNSTAGGGSKMQKAGDEHYLLAPDANAGALQAGTYYVAVASEGTNPGNGRVGSGTSSFVLTSRGALNVVDLGTVDNSGATDILAASTNKAGQVRAYTFTVPPDTSSMEITLEDKTGAPEMHLIAGERLSGTSYSFSHPYGYDYSTTCTWAHPTLINVINPAATNYTLVVRADPSSGDAEYTLRIHATGVQTVTFDGGMANVINQQVGTWRFFRIEVPQGALGWDVRIDNPTGGSPALVVRRDILPAALQTDGLGQYGLDFRGGTTWSSGYHWTADADWTGYNSDYDGTSRYRHILQAGMNNPLEPGTYYVGIQNTHNNQATSYTLRSRGIGTGMAIPVTPLAYSNGVATITDLPPREVAYFSVEVPSGMPSWSVELNNAVGEGLLMVLKDRLPNIRTGGTSKIRKTGDEHFLLVPDNNTPALHSGTYYVAVASQGVNPVSDRIGNGTSSFVLTSHGALNVINLGTIDTSGATDLIMTSTNKAGQIRAYQFTVPPDTSSLEVTLEDKTGNPSMYLRADNHLSHNSSYGSDGTTFPTWTHGALINVINPVATNYTLMVQAGTDSDAGYTLRVHAMGAQTVAFDGGTATVVNQKIGTWRFFRIEVPQGALGWDVRLENVTSGSPAFAICRSSLPENLGTTWLGTGSWSPQGANSWPEGYTWALGANAPGATDWTGYRYDDDGADRNRRIWQASTGNPLVPGIYYIGVIDYGSPDPMSYTLVSRGIGTGMTLPVTPLSFSNGVATITGLLPREAAYFSVEVPNGMPSWSVELNNTVGEGLLMVQKDFLPNIGAGGGSSVSVSGGRKMQKAGDEHYLLMPAVNATDIPAGTYYIAVASEGMNPDRQANGSQGRVGNGASSFALISHGVLDVVDLGTVDNTGATEILMPDTSRAGQCRAYTFRVPPDMFSLEVSLEDRAGSLSMFLRADERLSRHGGADYGIDSGMGQMDGVSPTWAHGSAISIAYPAAATYTLVVQASTGNDTEYTLRVRQAPMPELAFDASLGNNVASGILEDGRSAYYTVEVPATLNGQPVLGWRLKAEQTSGSASVRVRKDGLPFDNGPNTPWQTGEAVIVPAYLTPGTWYVEIRGAGMTTAYTLTSSAIQQQQLTRTWLMPAPSGTVTTPGLPSGGALFADTGVNVSGNALPGDQGIDLAAETFHYYTIVVPPGNAGLMRMALNAINGRPSLYVRAGSFPSTSHQLNGNTGGIAYDRTMATSANGSLYANWVPFNGRFEKELTPGTWYVAVYAGTGNARYRLMADTGNVKTLDLNGGGDIAPRSLAARDFIYYAVDIPTNAPVNWVINYSVQLGNVTCHIRDRIPAGQRSRLDDYANWNSDNKNHGPYPSYSSPDSYTISCPPLRPGNTYYIGFYANSDATLSVNCSTNGGTINYAALPFHTGAVETTLLPYEALRYRIDVPANAKRLTFAYTNQSSSVRMYLEQGSVPTRSPSDHWNNGGYYAIQTFDQDLTNPTVWPWQPDYSYFLVATNTSDVAQSFSLYVRGQGGEIFADPFYFTDVVCDAANGLVYLSMKVNPGQAYTLIISTDLQTWTDVQTFTPDTATHVITHPFTEDRLFFKLRPQ